MKVRTEIRVVVTEDGHVGVRIPDGTPLGDLQAAAAELIEEVRDIRAAMKMRQQLAARRQVVPVSAGAVPFPLKPNGQG